MGNSKIGVDRLKQVWDELVERGSMEQKEFACKASGHDMSPAQIDNVLMAAERRGFLLSEDENGLVYPWLNTR